MQGNMPLASFNKNPALLYVLTVRQSTTNTPQELRGPRCGLSQIQVSLRRGRRECAGNAGAWDQAS